VLGRVPRWVVRWILVPLALLLVLRALVVGTFHVVGASMEDTLQPGDFLLVSKVGASAARISDWLGAPAIPVERGDLVVFRFPRNPSLVLVKRVIGLPGDRVQLEGQSGFDGVVPEGDVFVLGDNRTPGASSDSREWGYLPSHQIIGRAVMRLLPLRRAGLLGREHGP